MKRLIYLSMAALMLLAVSCNKENKPQNNEPVNPLPTTVWTASWTHSLEGALIPFTATIVFEKELVSLVVSTLEIRMNEVPCIQYGRSQYRFVPDSDGGGEISFTLSFQSSNPLFVLPETSFSGTYDPDSKVLRLEGFNHYGTDTFGVNDLEFIKDPNQTTKINPLPATTWTASWTAPSEFQFPVKAFLAFESTSVSLIIAPEMKMDGTPVVMYGKAPYKFEYPSETDPTGNVSFTVSTRSSTVFMLPELTFSGTFNPESDVLKLKVSSTDNNIMFKDALDFVKN